MDRYSSSSSLLAENGRAAGDEDEDLTFTSSVVYKQHEEHDEEAKSRGMGAEHFSIHIEKEHLEDSTLPDPVGPLAVPLASADTPVVETPLPMGKMVPIMLLTASESFNSSAIFSYVGYLVLDFNLTDDKKELGNYAGAISSCFFVAQFISSFFWGKMSDRYGRRPILLCGAIGTLISAVLFGFSMNFTFAVVSRALCGLLNGNIGVLKTYLGEVTDSSNQTRAWSWFSLASGAGAVVGALAGGVLAQPATKYPKLFAAGHGVFGGLLEEFPYLLPNLMAVLVVGVGFILSYIYLTENDIPPRVTVVERETYGPLGGETGDALVVEADPEAPSTAERGDEYEEDGIEMKVFSSPDWQMKTEIATKETEDRRQRRLWVAGGGAEARSDEAEQDQKECSALHAEEHGRPAAAPEGGLHLAGLDESTLQDRPDGGSQGVLSSLRGSAVLRLDSLWGRRQGSAADEPKPAVVGAKTERSVLLQGQVILSTSLYGLTGMLYIFIDAVFPLWTMTDPKEGGLGFSTDQIGITSSVGSLSIIVIQLAIYGPLARKVGLINTFKWGTLAAVPIFVAFPVTNYLHPDVNSWSSMPLMWLFIITIYIIRTFVGQLMFCAVMNLINNSVDVYNMGAANGLGQSLVALLRAIGPYFSSVLFAWSMTSGMMFPFNFYFVFVLISVIALFIFALAFFLNPSLNTPKPLPSTGGSKA